ncbi:augmin subunit 2, partial [Tanacetum coccineum]
WFSLNEKGEHCRVISIEDCLIPNEDSTPQYQSHGYSRFPKIIDMACTCMRHWSCNSNIIMSPTVASAGNNLNSSKVLVLGGTGRVGGSTTLALSKLKPDLRLVIAGRADIQLYADIANWTGLLWILDKFDDWYLILNMSSKRPVACREKAYGSASIIGFLSLLFAANFLPSVMIMELFLIFVPSSALSILAIYALFFLLWVIQNLHCHSELDCNSPTEPALTNSEDLLLYEAAGHPQEDSSLVYTLTGELLKKLALIAPSHRKFFIVELLDLAHSLSSKAVQELITLKNTHMLGLSTGSMAGSSVLRILQTLNSLTLVDGNKSKGVESDGNQEHVTLWQELSDHSLPLGTQRLLPFIEAFLDRVIARLQQPVPLEYIPERFLRTIQSVARDYGTLAASVSDIHWTRNFQEPPCVWRDMLRPIHVALVSCSRYFESMSAMRESFTTLQMLRVVPTNSPNIYHSQLPSPTGSDCVTPYSSGNISPRFQKGENQEGEVETDNDVDDTNGRRLSWHSDMDKANFIEASKTLKKFVANRSSLSGFEKKKLPLPKSGGISSTPTMRGTVCYVVREYSCGGDLLEKCDDRNFGVLLSLYSRYGQGTSFNLYYNGTFMPAKNPTLQPSMKEIVAMLSSDLELPSLPVKYSPSPPSRFRSHRKARMSLIAAGPIYAQQQQLIAFQMLV